MNGRYGKRQILLSDKYSDYRDVLAALLNENLEYSIDEIDEIIEEFSDRVFVRGEEL
ncbi:MAG: hypothetical protein ACI4VF_03195 [Lachnospirales bacterium]